MEQALMSIFSMSFLVFALVIAIAVLTIRNLVEFLFKKAEVVIPDKIEDVLRDVWREWVVRGLPLVIGGLFGLFLTGYPYPADFAGSDSGRVFFGLIAGLFSSTIYSFAKFHVRKYLPENIKQKIDNMNPLASMKKEE